YTGKVRASEKILETQTAAYVKRDSLVVDALHQLKLLAVEMKNALLKGRLMDFGAMLNEGWQAKKGLATQITDPSLDSLYDAAIEAGAVGGKLLGAGGGGYFLLFVPFHRRHLIAAGLERMGGQVVPVVFEPNGVLCWDADNYLDTGSSSEGPDTALSDTLVLRNLPGRVV
ncbi:MAG: hypothetical protein ACYCOU_24310, partial [Sulfobacillus sp.]